MTVSATQPHSPKPTWITHYMPWSWPAQLVRQLRWRRPIGHRDGGVHAARGSTGTDGAVTEADPGIASGVHPLDQLLTASELPYGYGMSSAA